MENFYPSIFGLTLIALLALLAWIDFVDFILPNILNGILAFSGFIASYLLEYIHPEDAILGAAIGLFLLGSVAYGFRKFKGYEGLGMGDVKFAGAAGFWVGWQGVPMLVLIASLSALMMVLLHIIVKGEFERDRRLPFGPFLAAGTGLTWFHLMLT